MSQASSVIVLLYWGLIDPIANERELRLVRSGLAPLVEDVRAVARRAGPSPADIAAVLARLKRLQAEVVPVKAFTDRIPALLQG